jgi:hypothetical protein
LTRCPRVNNYEEESRNPDDGSGDATKNGGKAAGLLNSLSENKLLRRKVARGLLGKRAPAK